MPTNGFSLAKLLLWAAAGCEEVQPVLIQLVH